MADRTQVYIRSISTESPGNDLDRHETSNYHRLETSLTLCAKESSKYLSRKLCYRYAKWVRNEIAEIAIFSHLYVFLTFCFFADVNFEIICLNKYYLKENLKYSEQGSCKNEYIKRNISRFSTRLSNFDLTWNDTGEKSERSQARNYSYRTKTIFQVEEIVQFNGMNENASDKPTLFQNSKKVL